jgi:hypothetical protein
MGYRTYIGSMLKKDYNKIKSMSREQLIEHYKLEDEGYIGMGVYDFGEELYEFGKYTEFNPPKKSLKTFFKNKELNKYFTAEHDFNIVTAEFVEYVIETYKKRICDYYNNMMNPFFGVSEIYNPCDFLKSIKTNYSYPENNITFDFTKITQEEQNNLFKIIQHVRDMRTEWTLLEPYNLKKGESVTASWKYEYSIFELIRIYKSFDWKRKVMIFYGY